MLKHIVFMKFKPEVTGEDMAGLKRIWGAARGDPRNQGF